MDKRMTVTGSHDKIFSFSFVSPTTQTEGRVTLRLYKTYERFVLNHAPLPTGAKVRRGAEKTGTTNSENNLIYCGAGLFSDLVILHGA